MKKVTKSEVKKWKAGQEKAAKKENSKETKQSAKSAQAKKPKNAPVCYMDEIIAFIKAHKRDSGIVYVLSRKEAGEADLVELRAENTSEELKQHDISCAFYHAGMTSAQRIRVQQAWTSDQIRVVCATIAYGMGIDKEDVRYVIHTVLPKSLEGYYQESGRVGIG